MPRNLISITFPPARTAAIDKAMTALEAALSDLVALEPDARRRLTRMGDKSESFCRKTLAVVAQNPQVVNPSLGLPDAQADLAAYDALRPRRLRLQKLIERMQDTEILLGTDVMAAALEAYGLLKVSGKSQGLSRLRQGLGARFKRNGRGDKPSGESGEVA